MALEKNLQFSIKFGGGCGIKLKRRINYQGESTPFVGNFLGMPFYCFFELNDINHFIAPGISIKSPAVRPVILGESSVDIESLDIIKSQIQKITMEEVPDHLLTLDYQSTIIRNLENGYYFVRQVWNNGQIQINWSQKAVRIPGLRVLRTNFSSIIDYAMLSATYVLTGRGKLVKRRDQFFLENITANDGTNIAFNKIMDGVDIYTSGTMSIPFPGANNRITGLGHCSNEPLINHLMDPELISAKFNPDIFTIFGKVKLGD